MHQSPYDMKNAFKVPASNHDICPIHPEDGSVSSLTKRVNLFNQDPMSQPSNNRISSDEVYDLFHLIPQPSAPVGLTVPTADELDRCSQPVPQKLLEKQVEWHRYGFYNAHGN